LDGVTVCGLGLMAGVSVQLGQEVLVDPFSVALAIGAFLVLRRFSRTQRGSYWAARRSGSSPARSAPRRSGHVDDEGER
jgi:hypothetical protein